MCWIKDGQKDRLYPSLQQVFSEGRDLNRVELSEGGRGSPGGGGGEGEEGSWGRNNNKTSIGQIKIPTAPLSPGPAGIGLKCPFAQNLPHFHPPPASRVPSSSPLLLNKPAFVCVCPGAERMGWGRGAGSVCQNRPPECVQGPAVWMSKYFPFQMKGAIIAVFKLL